MIRHTHPAPDLETTTEAHVRAVAKECGDEPLRAGGWLYAVRKVPRLGAPVIYRCRVEVRHG